MMLGCYTEEKQQLFFLPANVLVIGNYCRRLCVSVQVCLIFKSPRINSKLETYRLLPLFPITNGSLLMDWQSHAFGTFKNLFAIKTDVDTASFCGFPLNLNSDTHPPVFKLTRTGQNNRRITAGFL